MKPYCGSLAGCNLRVSLIEGRDKGLCYYHWKDSAGYFEVPHEQPVGALVSSILSSEQVELAVILRALGVPGHVAAMLLTRQVDAQPKPGEKRKKAFLPARMRHFSKVV